ncbi:sugar transferase [Glycomyces niveus]|jgi:exopolysaccharide biosynthesis polyprenyl glycosylphosphotransferase|uniref:Sugar transferase n=1 Tax=Glycomyces niveus TaxID=2820287 RepID=A0ABS3U1D2_9ACTN|nr:sugar transferase [Glycomyces sp. NEAU-S30]MBO3732545.1 sugar transferase [Glycomyces sp. NEAU-S30]
MTVVADSTAFEGVHDLPARGRVYSIGPQATRPYGGPPAWQRKYFAGIIASDVTAGILGAALAFFARFGHVNDGTRVYALALIALPAVWIAALGLSRAFEKRYLFVGTEEYQRIVHAAVALTAAVAIVSYGLELPTSRVFVLIAIPTAAACSIVARFGWRKWLHRMRRGGRCMKRVVLVGHESSVAALIVQLRREHYHGLNVVAACLPTDEPRGALLDFDTRIRGSFDRIAEAVAAERADTVIVLGCPEIDGQALRRLAWKLERSEVDLIVASALVDVAGDRTTVRPVDGLPMLHLDHARLTGVRRLAKEAVDRIGAAMLLLALSPLLLTAAFLIRCTSPGPALFKQERIGKDGQPFTIWKFRTMHLDAERRLAEIAHLNEGDGVLFKMKDDPRITKVGKYLRRFSIDEFPQLVNVLRGDMSLVGPRPPLAIEVAAYESDMRRRLAVKPGMTGLWQVSGRSDLPWEEAVRLDLRYVEHWNLSLDFVILLRTVTAILRPQGAY